MFLRLIITTYIFQSLLLSSLSCFEGDFFNFALSLSQNEHACLNQNRFKLVDEIPSSLQNLPYAVYPTDTTYNTVRFNFNKRFNVFPKAIFMPQTFDDVQYVFNILKANNLDFSIRSGGHCFEPGSLSSDYIFDLRNFNSIIPNTQTGEVYVGAGALLTNVISTLGAINYAIPTGTCPTVGATGLSLGGGIGLLVRTYGLTCDSVTNFTLLTANNGIIEVNSENHPDLFWALKGAGNGSYGIVLGIKFKMHSIPTATFYELAWDWDPEQTYRIVRTWQKWVRTLPSSINSSIRLEYREGVIAIRIIGIKVGTEEFSEWIDAFKNLNPPRVKVQQGSYLSTVSSWSGQPSLPFNKSKSKILLKPLSKHVVRDIVEYLSELNHNQPNVRIFLNFDAFGGNFSNFTTAFPFRQAFGWWYFGIYWPYQTQDALALKLINQIYYKVSSKISPYSYANVPDYELDRKYLKAYYDGNVDRLIQIKNQYDPGNIFKWKQSIPLCPKHKKIKAAK